MDIDIAAVVEQLSTNINISMVYQQPIVSEMDVLTTSFSAVIYHKHNNPNASETVTKVIYVDIPPIKDSEVWTEELLAKSFQINIDTTADKSTTVEENVDTNVGIIFKIYDDVTGVDLIDKDVNVDLIKRRYIHSIISNKMQGFFKTSDTPEGRARIYAYYNDTLVIGKNPRKVLTGITEEISRALAVDISRGYLIESKSETLSKTTGINLKLKEETTSQGELLNKELSLSVHAKHNNTIINEHLNKDQALFIYDSHNDAPVVTEHVDKDFKISLRYFNNEIEQTETLTKQFGMDYKIGEDIYISRTEELVTSVGLYIMFNGKPTLPQTDSLNKSTAVQLAQGNNSTVDNHDEILSVDMDIYIWFQLGITSDVVEELDKSLDILYKVEDYYLDHIEEMLYKTHNIELERGENVINTESITNLVGLSVTVEDIGMETQVEYLSTEVGLELHKKDTQSNYVTDNIEHNNALDIVYDGLPVLPLTETVTTYTVVDMHIKDETGSASDQLSKETDILTVILDYITNENEILTKEVQMLSYAKHGEQGQLESVDKDMDMDISFGLNVDTEEALDKEFSIKLYTKHEGYDDTDLDYLFEYIERHIGIVFASSDEVLEETNEALTKLIGLTTTINIISETPSYEVIDKNVALGIFYTGRIAETHSETLERSTNILTNVSAMLNMSAHTEALSKQIQLAMTSQLPVYNINETVNKTMNMDYAVGEVNELETSEVVDKETQITISINVIKDASITESITREVNLDLFNLDGEPTVVETLSDNADIVLTINPIKTTTESDTVDKLIGFNMSYNGKISEASEEHISKAINTTLAIGERNTTPVLTESLSKQTGMDYAVGGMISFERFEDITKVVGLALFRSERPTPTVTDTLNKVTDITTENFKKFTITLNKQSGTGGTDSITFVNGVAGNINPTSITPPTRTNYVFQGYFTGTNGAGTKRINSDGTYASLTKDTYTDNATLYAHWTIANVYYDWNPSPNTIGMTGTISTSADGTSWTSHTLQTDWYQQRPADHYFKVTDVAIPVGWKYSSYTTARLISVTATVPAVGSTDGSGIIIQGQGDLSNASNRHINIYVVGIDYTVTVNQNSGTGSIADKSSYTVSTTNTTINMTPGTRAGYVFSHWTVSGANGKATVSGNVITIPAYTAAVASYGNLTITANWTIKSQTVVWKSYAGAVLKSEVRTVGQTSTAPTGTPDNAAYDYSWPVASYTPANDIIHNSTHTITETRVAQNTGASNSETVTKATSIDTTVTNPITITLNKQSGSGGTDSITSVYNRSLNPTSPISVPTRTGYDFQGYYTGTGGSGTQRINSSGAYIALTNTTYSANATLYAHWVPKNITVTLNVQSGTGGTTSIAIVYATSVTPTSITVPSRTGYTFQGYYTSTNGGGTKRINADGTYAALTSTTYSANATLYAYWVANSFNITLDKQSGTGGTSTIAVVYNTSITAAPITPPTRTGYTFQGYYTGTGGSGTKRINANGTYASLTSTTYSAAATLYAYWTPTPYTLTKGSTPAGVATFVITRTASPLGGSTGALNTGATIYIGDTLTVAATASNGYNAPTVSASNITVSGNTTVTVTAGSLITYTITVDNNGGAGASNATYNVTTSSTLTALLGESSRLYHVFKGWRVTTPSAGGWTNGTLYAPSTNVNGKYANVTLQAHWVLSYAQPTNTESLNKNVGLDNVVTTPITITLNKQSGTGGTSSITSAYGISLNPTSITPPTRTGYDFQGYYTSTGGGGTKRINANGTYAALTNTTYSSAVTLYAYWTPKNITINLDRQNGTGGTTSISVVYATSVTPSSVTPPTRSGYVFQGYYTGTNGTGTKRINANGTYAALTSTTYTDATTLYAHWTASGYTWAVVQTNEPFKMIGKSTTYYLDTTGASGNRSPKPRMYIDPFSDEYSTNIVSSIWSVFNDLYPDRGSTLPTTGVAIGEAFLHNGVLKIRTG